MPLNRRELLSGAVAAATVPEAAAAEVTNGQRPNVLLIFMDDQSFRTIGSINNPEVHTPNLDRLAASGTTFTHAFNQGAWSGAVCIPSRAMLISGLTVWHCEHKLESVPLWGEWFAQHGYKTFLTGKWHNGEATIKRCFTDVGPWAGGFLPSVPNLPEAKNDAYNRPSAISNTWRPDDVSRGGHWLQFGGKTVHSSVHWADSAIDFLTQQASPSAGSASTQPFFMHVAFHAPHDPRQSPTEFLDLYPIDRIKIPPNYLPEHPFDQGDSRVRDELLAPFPRTKESVRLHRREYYAILSHVDQQIGRILDTLDATGHSKNTVILFSGDHGLAVGQHGLMGKQNQYDHSVRIPLIMAGPGIPVGKRNESLVYQSGLFPTACDLCGLPTPKTVEHRSMVKLVKSGSSNGYETIYGGYLRLQRMVRDHDWKLILYPEVGVTQLFNIRKDPWEITNHADDPTKRTLIADMKMRLQKIQTEIDDTLVIT